ncbi:Vps16, N-terminal region-domain-containing protein [Mortierella sp. GBAus27b]|nr:Vps16, N-terminal region-domain-containing protein [Mortierella sp. GBAus27b]
MAKTPTADWFQLQDRFYRKQEIYVMLWDQINLLEYNLAAAPFGGPLALVRDDRKVLLLQKQQSVKPSIYLYTSSGKLLETIQWEKGRIVGMGWTDNEQLLCVFDDGIVRMYNILGESTQFSLGKVAKDRIIDVQIWGTGLVALTGSFQLISVTNFDEPKPTLLADPEIHEPPHSWTIIPPKHTLSRHVEVLLAVNSTIYVVDGTVEVRDERLQQGPFTKMSVSPNGKYLALFTSEGKLWVVSTDFQKNLSEFETKSKVPPIQLAWCGTDSVILYWDSIVLMVGPFGGWIKYTYDEAIFLVPEIDGVRVISSEKCEFLQKVPDVTENIFKIGSTTPAAMLYDALDSFEKKLSKSDENIRSIRLELSDAVEACIEAAGHEFSHYYQRLLLKAASFGKSFLEIHNADSFVEMCKVLRVLNAVRHFEIGIPLTYTQYQNLSPDALIDRLISRHQYLLAIRICEYLKMRTDRILIHWACSKIKKSNEDEDTICRMVVEKLANKPGLSFSEIAMTAHKVGRSKLATMLLDYEPRAGDQVPLLMSMEQDELALTKAIESGDTDLIYYVLLYLKRKLNLQDFMRIIVKKPIAINLLESYCKQQNTEANTQLLTDLYYTDDRLVDSANLTLIKSFQLKNTAERIPLMKEAVRLYQEAKDHSFEAKAVDSAVKLLQVQTQLEKDYSQTFIGQSISSTVYKLITINQGNRASKVRSEFKMPDKRFWWIKLRALVEIRDWEGVATLAKSKSPIGYEPFVEECVKTRQFGEASKYIMKCDAHLRAGLFLKIEYYLDAAEQAFQQKDLEMLQDIRRKCSNVVTLGKIDDYMALLASSR